MSMSKSYEKGQRTTNTRERNIVEYAKQVVN